MSAEATIRKSMKDGILRLSLDRPSSKNTLDQVTVSALREAISTARNDPELRLLILSSAVARVFCLGMDLGLLKSAGDVGAWQVHAAISDYADLLVDLATIPVPSLAIVDGMAAGGGVELALLCDMVVATPDASFSVAQLRNGLFPFITSAVVAPRIGQSRFLHWALSGQNFPAGRMLELGLVNQVVAAGELERAVSILVDRVSGFDAATLRAGIASVRADSGASTVSRIRQAQSLFALNCVAKREGGSAE